MDIARFIELLREEFEKQLQSKTGWGRIEVMTQFDRSSVIAIAKMARENNIVLD